MRTFDSLTVEQKILIGSHFILPLDTSKVEVSNNLVPFERISGALVGCTVINTNFHIHELKNR